MEAMLRPDAERRKRLLQYSMPLIAANLLQSFYGLTDLYLAGRFLGSAGISAINNAGQVMSLYTFIIIGLVNGGNVLVGQYYGSMRKRECAACAGSLLSLFALIGVFFAVALAVSAAGLMELLRAPALEEAILYLRFCAPGALAIAGYNAIAAIFRGVGNAKGPLLFVAVSVSANIVLDVLFMGVLGMGVEGAAIATTLSQYLSMLIAGLAMLSKHKALALSAADLRMRPEYVKRILSIGSPCAVQMTVASVSWLSVTFLLNHYGVAVSAANGVSAKIKDVVQTITGAISLAATSMIAQTLGAKAFDEAKAVLYAAMRLAVLVSVVSIIAVELFAPQLIAFFNEDVEVVRAGTLNLRIEIVAQIFYAMFMIYHSLMTGAGDTRKVLFSSFVNCILVRTVLAVLLNGLWGATGVYIACAIAPAASVPIGIRYVKSNVWRRSLIDKAPAATLPTKGATE